MDALICLEDIFNVVKHGTGHGGFTDLRCRLYKSCLLHPTTSPATAIPHPLHQDLTILKKDLLIILVTFQITGCDLKVLCFWLWKYSLKYNHLLLVFCICLTKDIYSKHQNQPSILVAKAQQIQYTIHIEMVQPNFVNVSLEGVKFILPSEVWVTSEEQT